jgi:hypothetical protein
MPLPIENPSKSRLVEMGLRQPELISRLGYKNFSLGLRGLSRFCADAGQLGALSWIGISGSSS